MIGVIDTIIGEESIFNIFVKITDYHKKLLRQMERPDQASLSNVNKNQKEYDPVLDGKSNSGRK
jgi:hypothetical protein